MDQRCIYWRLGCVYRGCLHIQGVWTSIQFQHFFSPISRAHLTILSPNEHNQSLRRRNSQFAEYSCLLWYCIGRNAVLARPRRRDSPTCRVAYSRGGLGTEPGRKDHNLATAGVQDYLATKECLILCGSCRQDVISGSACMELASICVLEIRTFFVLPARSSTVHESR